MPVNLTFLRNRFSQRIIHKMSSETLIQEGSAQIHPGDKVFYNPVQEFNRDLSISVLNSFGKLHPDGPGLRILEALAATGLRSIRYAKEVTPINKIIANDLSIKAVEVLKNNIKLNGVEDLVEPSHSDAMLKMYENRAKDKQFDVIDLDPYGCPSIFLDSAVQSVKDGGLLMVTATDMAVLAGNSPETCHVKYGAVSLKIKSCHEMAIRILLKCIESHANRYGRFIEPLLSISVDFYIRVFVRISSGASKCKLSTSKLSYVFHCTGCGSYKLFPLGIIKKETKCGLPTFPGVGRFCDHCNHPQHMGGPIWSAPIHHPQFVSATLESATQNLQTYKRIEGILTVILEELQDVPLYYTLQNLSGVLHVETPSILKVRSALLHAGYAVSYSHMHKNAIKTDAPAEVLWDIMRTWALTHPVHAKRLTEQSPAKRILEKKPEKEYNFEPHLNANPQSKKLGLLRFQNNPLKFWGPGTRNTANQKGLELDNTKSKINQGKRKRDASN